MTLHTTNKPTFPIGWTLPDGASIKQRIDRKLFVEIFLLDNKEFIYVFHDPEVRRRLKERNIEHDIFVAGGVEYVTRRYESHSDESLLARIDEINNLRGLEAIAGMAELKSILLRDVIHPLQNRTLYERYKLSIPNGVLFFGPPGCGKTYIARRISEALGVPLLEVSGSDVGSSYIHATSKNIGDTFKKAFAQAPCVLFFDEISSLVPRRENLASHMLYKEAEVSEFLTKLEGAGNKGVLVVGATNFPERIDTAVLRSGRMDKRIFIPPPDYNARIEMFRMMMDGRPQDEGISFELLATLTDGYVASDIRLLVDNAARAALLAGKAIDTDCLQKAIATCRPSVTKDDIAQYSQMLDIERK